MLIDALFDENCATKLLLKSTFSRLNCGYFFAQSLQKCYLLIENYVADHFVVVHLFAH